MKKKKNKELSLVNVIDFGTDKLLVLIKKLNKLITSKISHDTIYIFSKVIVTFVLLWLLRIPFVILEQIGVAGIYTVGSTFRHILSASLQGCCSLAYLLLCFIILLKVISAMFADKELNFIEKNRRKDAKVKAAVFNPLIKIIKVCLYILLVPLFVIVILVLIGLGMALALLVYSHPLYGLFPALIGFLIMICSVILIVNRIINGVNEYNNKYVNILLSGFACFLVGVFILSFELATFSSSSTLPNNFYSYKTIDRISINDNLTYRIKKGLYNQNITIEKVVDDSLEDEIVIEEQYMNTSRVITTVVKDKYNSTIVFTNEFNLSSDDIKSIYHLIIRCLKEKTIYNYNLLKYSKIVIYGNEEVLSNIKIDGYEK